MDERRGIGWQAWLAGGLFLTLLIAALLINMRASRPQESPPPAAVPPAPTPSASAVVPQPEAALDRTALLAAARAAASDYVSGATAPTEAANIAGRRFELRLPFGCDGPVTDGTEPAMGWRYDAKDESLRAFARPQDWTKSEWLRPLLGDSEIQSAEGFWIERPWILRDACPSPATPDEAAVPPATEAPLIDEALQQFGLVELLSEDAPRSAARGGRAYTAVVKRTPEMALRDTHFTLVMTGRIANFPTGGVIACWGDGRAEPPHCLIAARIERVAIDDAGGERLAEWQR